MQQLQGNFAIGDKKLFKESLNQAIWNTLMLLELCGSVEFVRRRPLPDCGIVWRSVARVWHTVARVWHTVAGTADTDQHLHTVGQRLGRLATGKDDIGDNDCDHLDLFVLRL